MNRSISRFICTMTCIALASCSRSSNSTTQPPAAPATSQFDLEATVNDYIATLETEAEILRIELDPDDSVDADDIEKFWSALQQRIEHADEIQAMIEADLTWLKSICGWYEAKLAEPHLEVVRLRNRIARRDGDSTDPSGYAELLKAGAGSAEAARDYLTTMRDHPGELTNLHISCIRFGHIEDE